MQYTINTQSMINLKITEKACNSNGVTLRGMQEY